MRLDEIVLRALEAKPERRYQNAGEFRTQLMTVTSDAGVPPAEPGVAAASARVSRTAIVGACWAPLGLLAAIWLRAITGQPVGQWSSMTGPDKLGFVLTEALGIVGFLGTLGTTILGWIAVSHIRRSAGKRRGLGLAVFDGLLFPLLALDVAILLIVGNLWRANPPEVSHPAGRWLAEHEFIFALLALLIGGLVDWLIIRAVWRAVSSHGSLPKIPPDDQSATEMRTQAETFPSTVPVGPAAPAFVERRLFHWEGITRFRSPVAWRVAQLATVGCLGFLGWIPGGDRLFGFFGFFGFLGAAYVIEALAGSASSRRRVGALVAAILAAGLLAWAAFWHFRRSDQDAAGLADRPEKLRTASNAQVIAAGLAKPLAPWAWQELERRPLTAAEAEQVLNELTGWMQRTFPMGCTQPLSWLDEFLNQLDARGLARGEPPLRLLQAIHGSLRGEPQLRLRAGEKTLDVQVECRYRWRRDLMGLVLMNEVQSITIDGQPAERRPGSDGFWNLEELRETIVLPALAPGRHTVRWEILSALVPAADLAGLVPSAPSADWPPARKRWTRTAPMELIVYPPAATIVNLVQDPALDPLRSGGLALSPVMIRSHGQRAQAVLSFGLTKALPVSVSFDVALRIGNQTISGSALWASKRADGELETVSGTAQTLDLERPAAELREAEIVLTPNPVPVEHAAAVERIWGKEIVLRHVPLKRLDAGGAPSATESPEAAASFGPTIERVVQPEETHLHSFLNLRTGELLSPPQAVWEAMPSGEPNAQFLQPAAAVQAWLKETGADLACPSVDKAQAVFFGPFGVGLNTGFGFEGFDEIKAAAFLRRVLHDERELKNQVGRGPLTFSFDSVPPGGARASDSWEFRRRDGSCGLLQYLGHDRETGGLRIRFKLVQVAHSAATALAPGALLAASVLPKEGSIIRPDKPPAGPAVAFDRLPVSDDLYDFVYQMAADEELVLEIKVERDGRPDRDKSKVLRVGGRRSRFSQQGVGTFRVRQDDQDRWSFNLDTGASYGLDRDAQGQHKFGGAKLGESKGPAATIFSWMAPKNSLSIEITALIHHAATSPINPTLDPLFP